MSRRWRRIAGVAVACAALVVGLWLAPPAPPRGDVAAAITFCPWTGTPLPIDPCGDGRATPTASPVAAAASPPQATATRSP